MKKIFLIDNKNKKVEVFLIRFFEYNGNQYLIYTLNEQDEKDYVKLYMVKVMKEFGRSISYHINDDDEWNNIKPLLKKILKEIKNNSITSFKDLNPDVINNMKVVQARVFKFDRNLVELFSKEIEPIKKEQSVETIVPQNPTIKQDVEVVDTTSRESAVNTFKEKTEDENIDYKKLYDETTQEIERLNKLLTDKIEENIQYKILYGELK